MLPREKIRNLRSSNCWKCTEIVNLTINTLFLYHFKSFAAIPSGGPFLAPEGEVRAHPSCLRACNNSDNVSDGDNHSNSNSEITEQSTFFPRNMGGGHFFCQKPTGDHFLVEKSLNGCTMSRGEILRSLD